MTDYGLVSIITPSYNSSQFISETIDSIVNQVYTNWELLITDDCSSDNSCDIIRQYSNNDHRIKLFCLTENAGAAVARNNSIKEAKGRYIAFCDSDDLWKPEKLEKQLDFMKKKNVEICYSSYLTCDEYNNITGIVVSYRSISYKQMLKDDSIGFLTFIYDTQTIGKIFMPLLRRRQDWAMKINLMQKCPMAYGMLDVLAYYRVHKNSLSNNKIKLIKYNVQVYKKVLRYNWLLSWVMFVFVFSPNYLIKKIRLFIINR